MVFIRTREHSISHSDILDTVSARCLLCSKCLMFNFNLFYFCKISKLVIYLFVMRSQHQYKTVSGYEKKCIKIASQYLWTILFWTFSIRDIKTCKQIVIRGECWSRLQVQANQTPIMTYMTYIQFNLELDFSRLPNINKQKQQTRETVILDISRRE